MSAIAVDLDLAKRLVKGAPYSTWSAVDDDRIQATEELRGILDEPATASDINKMFEAFYREQSESPVFIVNDMLVKDADGEYFHLATRTAFKFFKGGRASWTN